MILPDTSVWIDHIRNADAVLISLLSGERIVMHPFVIGELALGRIKDRDEVLFRLRSFATLIVARDDEVLGMIERHSLAGSGIGYVDAHLLAATRLTPGASIWSRDKRLSSAAERLGVAARLLH